LEVQTVRSAVLDLKGELIKHRDEDRADFADVRQTAEANRKEIEARFTDQTEDRARHLSEQDKKLDDLQGMANRAKGAGWAIIGLISAMATFIGGAVLAVVEGWLKVK